MKEKVTPAAVGGQLPANDISTESPAQHLSDLNNLLARETIDQPNAIAAKLRQKIAIMDANQSISAERTENLAKYSELSQSTVEQTKQEEAERRREELSQSVNRDMERCLQENNNLATENKAFASKISDLEEKGKKREELLKEKGDLVLKLEKEVELLNAENETLASKILRNILKASQKELKDVQKTLMACSVLSKLKKTATEAVGHEGAQDHCVRGHPPVEIFVIHGGMGGDSEKPSSLARLQRLVASSSMEDVGNPYNDAVVIKASIENILVHRVLLDSGSSVNVLYKRAFEKMGLDPRTLIPPGRPQFDSFGDRWEADGIVILPVTLGDDRGKYTRMTRFHVFDGPDHYNAIFGRPLLNDFQAIVYTYNLTMQFPADGRQVIVRGDVISARECYLRAVGGLEDSAQSKEGESRN